MSVKKIINAAGIIGIATIICKVVLDLSDNLLLIGCVLWIICLGYRIAKWREYTSQTTCVMWLLPLSF